MKKIFYCFVFTIVFISCKKEKELSFSERYEDEVYELINQSFLPDLDKKRINKRYKLPSRQIFENTLEINQDVRLSSYLSFINQQFLNKEIDSSAKYRIVQWNKNQLEETRIIDSLKRNKFLLLVSILREIEYPSEGYDSIKSAKLFHNYINQWEKEIGDYYVQISSPIFNINFTKAILLYRLHGSDYFCGTGSTGFKEFEKINNKWRMLKEDYDNY